MYLFVFLVLYYIGLQHIFMKLYDVPKLTFFYQLWKISLVILFDNKKWEKMEKFFFGFDRVICDESGYFIISVSPLKRNNVLSYLFLYPSSL